MTLTQKPIYQNGKYRVMPLVTFLRIEVEGRLIQTVGIDEIEEAVQTVDDLALRDGIASHVSM